MQDRRSWEHQFKIRVCAKSVKIGVLVKVNSKKESVEVLPDGSYLVRVNVPPVDGKANQRTQELLAKYLNLPKSSVHLVLGHKGKKKVFNIL